SHTGRENYLAQVRNLEPRQPRAHSAARQPRTAPRRSWAARFATIAAIFLIALSSLGGTVYAAQAAGPDDLLYDVKTLTEEIQVSLESDPEEKLDLYVSFANRRLQEIQDQVAAGEEVSQKALDLLEKHTEKMLEQAANMGGIGLDRALAQIETNLQKQNQMMAEIGQEQRGWNWSKTAGKNRKDSRMRSDSRKRIPGNPGREMTRITGTQLNPIRPPGRKERMIREMDPGTVKTATE
ncbi:MAG: DUF5667 domain-containing protein, partial [Anaerolineales bacterium]